MSIQEIIQSGVNVSITIGTNDLLQGMLFIREVYGLYIT